VHVAYYNTVMMTPIYIFMYIIISDGWVVDHHFVVQVYKAE
jgi:hypothetical protein